MKRRFFSSFLTVLTPTAVLMGLLFFFGAVDSLDREHLSEEKLHLEEALKNAAISCYAVEGAYPPNAEYLTEHYGVQVNRERFVVKYELYASNLMPDITVIERK